MNVYLFLLLLLLPIQVQGSVFSGIIALWRWGVFFRVDGGVHGSYTFQCGLVGLLPLTPDGRDRRLLVSPPKDTGKAG